MSAKHTPGPWHVDSIDRVRTLSGIVIARCERNERHEYMESHEQSSNARLIAAAPDLLAACDAMLAANAHDDGGDRCECDMTSPDTCAYCEVRAAIAKAKGED